ncbi:MAG TPA: hypothetical protein VHS74_06475 [Solirubrobacterales bacterium]|nr:hypothetical protein [Solirubrobacterales bacterium]
MTAEALARRVAALAGDRRLRLVIAVIGFAAVTLLTVLVAHPRMFSGFGYYDDEGYMLSALRGFIKHGELYDRVFTQYGPFYYEFWGGIFSLFGIDVTHDSGRTVTMIVWVLASLGFGLVMWRMTRSAVIGIGTQILAFNTLTALTAEPMHPVGLIALLLATILAVAVFVGERESPYALGLLGMAAAALVLVKINVGAFAVLSIALACVVSYPVLSRWRWPRWAVEALFVAVPILLVLSKFGEGWARHYGLHVAISALAIVIVLRARSEVRRSAGELRWLIGGFVLLAVLSCIVIVAAGTSPHGLIKGVITQPLHLSDAYTNPLQLSRRMYAVDVIGLAGAVAYWFALRRRAGAPGRAWFAVWSVSAIAVGVVMALSPTGQLLPFNAESLTGYQFTMLPLAWVALVATTPGEAATPSFARLLVPLLAVPQALHAFPVAGSQMWLATVLLVPTGALCVANGVRGLMAVTEVGADRLALVGFGVVATVVLAWFCVNTFLREPLNTYRAGYDASVPLNLPGSHDMRLSAEEDQKYEEITKGMRENCTHTLMEPGMASFYLWAQEEPPSYTATAWEVIFDEEQQEKVIDDTRSISGLCLLRNNEIQALWGTKEGLLTRYLEQGFKQIGSGFGYELLRRAGPYKGSL